MILSAQSRALHGTVALVTGATSGLGLETVRALAGLGVHVVIGARTPERGHATARLVMEEYPSAVLSVAAGDLATRDGVRSLAREVLRVHPRLDVIVNNAGVVRVGRHETTDGLEWTFAVNHLAPFLLTRLLLRALGERGRVVVVTSDAHRDASLDLDDLQSVRAYDPIVAYRQSKLANVMFARALARRAAGLSVFAVAPGIVATDIVREAPAVLQAAWAARARPAVDAVRTIVAAAVDPALSGTTGRYFSEGREMEPSADARDTELGDRLWEVSASLTRTAPAPAAVME